MDNASEVHDRGMASVVLIARFHGVQVDEAHVRHAHNLQSVRLAPDDCVRVARRAGLKARIGKLNVARLRNIPLPALIFDVGQQHFVLARVAEDSVVAFDPVDQKPFNLGIDELEARATGEVMLVASRASLIGELARFDFTWFVPAIVRYRGLLIETFLISLAIQLLALVSPLMFQVIMDKVLVYRTFNTLHVVCAALVIAAVLEVALTGLRNYIFSHTTNRIDVELGARIFAHVTRLPLSYFNVRRGGDTVARVREIENIRNFLTGQALTLTLDVLFSVIFIAVMFFYSVKLTFIVLLSLPLYAVISGVFAPVIKTRLDQKFSRGSDSQTFLMETVSSIETVKALAVEPQFRKNWERLLSSYVSASFNVTSAANVGQQLIQLVGRLVGVATIFFGAHQVIDGRLTLGGLVAFNMLAQHVSGPVLRLGQFWQDFQQMGVSMKRLGDVLNAPSEPQTGTHGSSQITGEIELKDVRFRYGIDGPLVLDDVCMRFGRDRIVGIVGRSGSGKSTLAKLIQRLYVPESGSVKIDGMDVNLMDAAWLRRQVGVVLQDNVLFNRTIKENIALTDPGTPMENVVRAAKLAGAHEFICELPQAYDSKVGERGDGLSGGQRQRVAIARALLADPRVLIFDEATSALDFETERIIQDNMRSIAKGRSVIIIAHRLSAVRDADLIIAMDRGRVVEHGTHDDLVASGGYYARLVASQSA